MPKPPCGTVPKRRRSRYHSNASRGSLCSSRRFSSSAKIVDALAAADDFAVSFGRDHIHAQRQFGPLFVGLEIECFDFGRIAVDDHRAVEILREQRFVGIAEIAAPAEFRCPSPERTFTASS